MNSALAFFELYVCIGTGILALACLALPKKFFGTKLLGTAIVAIALCLLLATLNLITADGLAWRLVPACTGLLLILGWILFAGQKSKQAGPQSRSLSLSRRCCGVAALLLCFASTAVIWIFPSDDLARPGGSYAVGAAAFELVDVSRTGIYLDAPDQPRRLMVQVWYPAEQPTRQARPLLWVPDESLYSAFAAYAGLPAFTMSQLGAVRSNSYAGLGLAPAQLSWPLVIISHGWTGSRFVHTDIAEELASRGIVVMALDHTYGSLSVSFPDGTTTLLDETALPPAENLELFARQSRRLVDTYAADIEALLAAVRLDSLPTFLLGKLDPARIALLGHSTGGAAVLKTSWTDSHLAAAVGLDAWLEPLADSLDRRSPVPQLHFGSAQWQNGNNRTYVDRMQRSNSLFDYFYVTDSAHMDFAMLGLFTRAARFIGWGGQLPRRELVRLVNGTVCDWLQASLLADPLIDGGVAAASAVIAAARGETLLQPWTP